MSSRPAATNAYEAGLLAQIDKFGWSVTSVFDPENALPSFSYSIGICETLQKPEVLVIGLRHDLGHWIINAYGSRAKRGEVFLADGRYGGFLKGLDVTFIAADSALASVDYTRSARWFHNGQDFPLLQIVWPDTSGAFPWQPDWPKELDSQQPLFGPVPASMMN